MKIWIFNHHALTPDMSGGTRHYDFAKELVSRGHSVTIIASSFHYSKYQEMIEYNNASYFQESIEGIDFIWIKTKPYSGNGVARVTNMLSYTFSVLKIIPTLKLPNPEIIIGSSVHLFAVYSAYKFTQKYQVPFVMEVRDIWPQTLIDMGVSKWHPFIVMLGYLERFLYKKAHKIISNLPYAYEHIEKTTSKDKFIWISNGVDISNLKYQDKENDKKFIISYAGAIGVANNLSILVNVAEKLKNNSDIFFRIVGDGAQKEDLRNLISEKKLTNIALENPVPKSQVSQILNSSDVLYFNLKDSPVFKFGISSNKLFDYMAAGRVIIFSSNARNNPIEEAGAGFAIKPDDVEELKDTILKIYNMSNEERNKIGRKVREHVEKYYSIVYLTDRLEALLFDEVHRFNV